MVSVQNTRNWHFVVLLGLIFLPPVGLLLLWFTSANVITQLSKLVLTFVCICWGVQLFLLFNPYLLFRSLSYSETSVVDSGTYSVSLHTSDLGLTHEAELVDILLSNERLKVYRPLQFLTVVSSVDIDGYIHLTFKSNFVPSTLVTVVLNDTSHLLRVDDKGSFSCISAYDTLDSLTVEVRLGFAGAVQPELVEYVYGSSGEYLGAGQTLSDGTKLLYFGKFK